MSGQDPRRDRRRALVALALLAPVPSLGVAAAMVVAPGPVGQAVFTAAKVWLVAFPILWHLAVDRRPPSWSPPNRGGLGVGVVTGLAAAVVIAGTAWAAGIFRADMSALAGEAEAMGLGTPGAFLLAAAGWTFVNSLVEEFVYRWFVLSRCETLMPRPAAVVASAAIFTAHHVIAISTYLPWGLTVLASFGVFAAGVLWAVLYARYRSIWPPWVSHVLADVAIFWVGWVVLFG